MTKEALIAFGLTEEQAEKAIQLHNAAMEGYVPKGTYDVLKAENENLVATVKASSDLNLGVGEMKIQNLEFGLKIMEINQ